MSYVGNNNFRDTIKNISFLIQFKNEILTEILQAVRYLFIRPSLGNKMSIFEEYGAFKE